MPDPLAALLWDPLPDPPPPPPRGLSGRLRRMVASLAGDAELGLSGRELQDLVDHRVRRGVVQALVREAYRAAVAEQDTAHRRPEAFAQAWKANLASLLDRPTVDLHGWSEHPVADLDTDLAWSLFEAASRARLRTVELARATSSKHLRAVSREQQAPVFEFAIVGDDNELGKVKYGTCDVCSVGLLYKIGFPHDWQFCGLGRLALSTMETRHPDLTWYTTGQYTHAKGFYDRYRRHSDSPWTPEKHPCPHLD